MQRKSEAFFNDILEAIRKIERYTSDISFEEFLARELIIDGVVRNLEVIGEAVKQMPANVREQHPEPEWRKMAGLRDILIHGYFGIDETIVWDIVQKKIPVLKSQITDILSRSKAEQK